MTDAARKALQKTAENNYKAAVEKQKKQRKLEYEEPEKLRKVKEEQK